MFCSKSCPKESRFAASLREFHSPRAVTFCGVMCALAVILSAAATINLGPYVKIGLSGLPNQAVDYLFGPAAGAVFSGALEVLKFMLRPDGLYFPGFTLSAVLSGMIYGFALYRRPLTFRRVLAAQVLVKIVVNLGCNTLWLVILYKKAAWAIFPARAAANLTRLPCDALVTYALLKTLERAVLPLFRGHAAER